MHPAFGDQQAFHGGRGRRGGHEDPRRFRRGGFDGGPRGSFGGHGRPGGRPGGRRGGGRARRGDVRAAMLALLAERPMHGYEIMQELAERTNGAWQPSPGSVYPALGRLREEGFISGEGRGDKQAFALTDKGTAEAEALRSASGPPWVRYAEEHDSETARLRESHEQLGEAVRQVARVGTGDQQQRARAAMDELRRKLYLILAEEPADEQAGRQDGEQDAADDDQS